MKAYKLKFGTYDGEGEWEKVFLNYTDLIKEYREVRREYEEDDTFNEHEPDKCFGVDGVCCEWYEIEIN
jgi:hypothetical protein